MNNREQLLRFRNIAVIALQALLLILLFISPFYNGYTLKGGSDYAYPTDSGVYHCGMISWGHAHGWSVAAWTNTGGSGTFAASGLFKPSAFARIMLFLCLAGIALNTLQLTMKKGPLSGNSPFTLIPPILEALYLGGFTLAAGSFFGRQFDGFRYDKWSGNYTKDVLRPATFFYVFAVLLVALIAVSVVGYLKIKKASSATAPAFPAQNQTME